MKFCLALNSKPKLYQGSAFTLKLPQQSCPAQQLDQYMAFREHGELFCRDAAERDHSDAIYEGTGQNAHDRGNGISGEYMEDTVDDMDGTIKVLYHS